MIKTKIFRGTGTQVPVYLMTEATFDETYPMQKPLIPANSGDVISNNIKGKSGGVGTLVITPKTAGYTAPATTACGIPKVAQDNTEAGSSFIKILKITGNYPFVEGQDVFVQIWSYPHVTTVTNANDTVVTGTLSDGDTSTGEHTLVFSKRIFENLMFESTMHRAIEVRNAIVAISNKETLFDITTPTIDAINFMVELESYV